MTRCLDTVVNHYLAASIWTEDDMPDEFYVGQFVPESRAQAQKDIEDFLALAAAQGVDTSEWGDDQLGHDFWLTRNGHGTGFWDREHAPVGRQLSDICKKFPARRAVSTGTGYLCIE